MTLWHLSDELLRRVAEGDASGPVLRHLRKCSRCRDRAEAMEEIRDTAQELIRVEPPADGWLRVQATLEADGGSSVPPLSTSPPAGSRFTRPYLKAAMLVVLGASAGVAAIAPGSPIRDMLTGAGAEPVVEETVRVSGVSLAVPPTGAVVRLSDVDPELRIQVEVTDRGELEIEGRAGASDAVFSFGVDEIAVTGAGPGVLWIGIPSTGGPVSVEHGTRRLVQSENGTLVLQGDSVRGTRVLLPLQRVEGTTEGDG